MPCKDFQEGKCSKQQDHEVGLITYKHICAYCLYTLNRMYGHSENVCNNKKRSKHDQHLNWQVEDLGQKEGLGISKTELAKLDLATIEGKCMELIQFINQ